MRAVTALDAKKLSRRSFAPIGVFFRGRRSSGVKFIFEV